MTEQHPQYVDELQTPFFMLQIEVDDEATKDELNKIVDEIDVKFCIKEGKLFVD